MTFQQENVERWAKDAKEMYVEHWKELGLDLDLEIAPDIAKMKAMEEMGIWKVLTAREAGRLAGYLLAVFSPHLHYSKAAPMFIVDAYYIVPEFRNGTGAKLLKFTESFARSLGAIKIYLSCKAHEDHSDLFVALGYRFSDFAFIKRI